MSTSARSATFKETLWAWTLAHLDRIFSVGKLLSTLWFAAAALLGLLLLMEPQASSFRLGLSVFSGVCLVAAAAAFTVVYLAGRERP